MSNGLFFIETPDALGRSRDVGFGAQPGDPGLNGIGIVRIEQIPNTYELLVTLTDGRALQFPLPAGPEGDPGVTPEFVNGEVVFGALGSAPRVVMRRLGIGLFAIDVQIPDYTIAVTAASNAQASEQAAAASKTAAAGSATAAAASVVQAAQKVTDAAAQVGFATAQANVATGAAADAIAAYDSFDDRYLGPKATDPPLDNDGNALVVGALYYNTGAQPGMRVRTAGGNWDKGYAVITGGVTSFKGREGAVSPQTGDYTALQIAGLATRSLFVSMVF